MKYIRGFLMAWGNFSAVPCPYHGWHEESRRAMLCVLPLIGASLAAISTVAWWLADLADISPIVIGTLVPVIYFCCNGFIHLDGFMDCCDAILSRRPELSERQRILKSSDVGAFAVICLVMMMMVMVASMISLAEDFSLEKASVLLVVMSISRGVAADAVGSKAAMNTSQYADLDEKRYKGGERFILIILPLVTTVLCFIIKYLVSGNENIYMYCIYIISVGIIVFAVSSMCGAYGRRQLGGMNGDISGYMIVLGEVSGVLGAALLSGLINI